MRQERYINSTYSEPKGLLAVSVSDGSWIWTSEIDGSLSIVNDMSIAGNIKTRGYIDIQNTNGVSKANMGLLSNNMYIGGDISNTCLTVQGDKDFSIKEELSVGFNCYTDNTNTLTVGGPVQVNGKIHGVMITNAFENKSLVNVNFLNSNFTTKVTNMHFAVEGLTGNALHKNYPDGENPNGYNWVHTNGNGELTQALNVSNNSQVCFTRGKKTKDMGVIYTNPQYADYAMIYPQTPNGQGILGNLSIGNKLWWIHGDSLGGIQSMGTTVSSILGTEDSGKAVALLRGSDSHYSVPYGDHTH